MNLGTEDKLDDVVTKVRLPTDGAEYLASALKLRVRSRKGKNPFQEKKQLFLIVFRRNES